MTHTDPTVRRGPAPRKARLPLGLVLGLSLLPLALSLPQALDPFGPAGDGTVQLIVAVLVTTAWAALVGGRGRRERPVATLVATGMLAGCWTAAIAVVVAVQSAGAVGLAALPLILAGMLAAGGLWGLLAGVLAVALQRVRGIPG